MGLPGYRDWAYGPLREAPVPGYPIYMKATLVLVGVMAFTASAEASVTAVRPRATAPSARASSVGFVPDYINSLKLSISQNPDFFAGQFLNSLDAHLNAITPMSTPAEVEGYLKENVLASAGAQSDIAQVSKDLGDKPLSPEAAAALIVANGIARPDQFGEIVDSMERMRGIWGQRTAEMMKAAGARAGVSRELMERLSTVGARMKPSPALGTYNAAGELNGLFDGSK